MEGIVLKSRINQGKFFTDRRIIEFSEKIASSDKLRQELELASKEYLLELISQTFDLGNGIQMLQEAADYLKKNNSSFNEGADEWENNLLAEIRQTQDVAKNFQAWVRSQFLLPGDIHLNIPLQDRLVKGSQYFDAALTSIITQVRKVPVKTDSRIHTKEFNELLRELFSELTMKRHLIGVFISPPDVQAWHQRKKEFRVPLFDVNVYAASSDEPIPENPHSQLLYKLRKLRDQICSASDLPIYIVASSKTLQEMTERLPQTQEDLRKINGFGDTKVKKYGQAFLDLIVQYCEENEIIPPIIEEEPPIKKAKPGKKSSDTKTVSLKLYQEGLSIPEIAIQRKLGVQTIEGHLSFYVESGEISIEGLVSHEILSKINAVLAIQPADQGLSGIKSQLDDKVQYRDIKFALAWQAFNRSGNPSKVK